MMAPAAAAIAVTAVMPVKAVAAVLAVSPAVIAEVSVLDAAAAAMATEAVIVYVGHNCGHSGCRSISAAIPATPSINSGIGSDSIGGDRDGPGCGSNTGNGDGLRHCESGGGDGHILGDSVDHIGPSGCIDILSGGRGTAGCDRGVFCDDGRGRRTSDGVGSSSKIGDRRDPQ